MSAIYSNKDLTKAQRFFYLEQALRGGATSKIVAGFSQTAQLYDQAIECLKGKYNRPRVMFLEHVRAILEAPVVNKGTGRE